MKHFQNNSLPNYKRRLRDCKWQDIAWMYTRCRLAFVRDKLPAISCVVRGMQISRNCEYVAGLLLDESFPLQLCWKRSNELFQDTNVRRPRPTERRVPSWSWAAVDSNITCIHTNTNVAPPAEIRWYIEIASFQQAPVGLASSPFSSTAVLYIHCVVLLPMALCAGPNHYFEIESLARECLIDGLKIRGAHVLNCANQPQNDLYLLLIGDIWRSAGICCLILQKTRLKNGQYRWIGHLQLELWESMEPRIM